MVPYIYYFEVYVHTSGTLEERQRRARRKETEKKGKRKELKKRENERKMEQAQTCAQGARRVPRGQGCRLLVRSVPWYVQLMDQQKDDTKRLDGRQTIMVKSRSGYYRRFEPDFDRFDGTRVGGRTVRGQTRYIDTLHEHPCSKVPGIHYFIIRPIWLGCIH